MKQKNIIKRLLITGALILAPQHALLASQSEDTKDESFGKQWQICVSNEYQQQHLNEILDEDGRICVFLNTVTRESVSFGKSKKVRQCGWVHGVLTELAHQTCEMLINKIRAEGGILNLSKDSTNYIDILQKMLLCASYEIDDLDVESSLACFEGATQGPFESMITKAKEYAKQVADNAVHDLANAFFEDQGVHLLRNLFNNASIIVFSTEELKQMDQHAQFILRQEEFYTKNLDSLLNQAEEEYKDRLEEAEQDLIKTNNVKLNYGYHNIKNIKDLARYKVWNYEATYHEGIQNGKEWVTITLPKIMPLMGMTPDQIHQLTTPTLPLAVNKFSAGYASYMAMKGGYKGVNATYKGVKATMSFVGNLPKHIEHAYGTGYQLFHGVSNTLKMGCSYFATPLTQSLNGFVTQAQKSLMGAGHIQGVVPCKKDPTEPIMIDFDLDRSNEEEPKQVSPSSDTDDMGLHGDSEKYYSCESSSSSSSDSDQ